MPVKTLVLGFPPSVNSRWQGGGTFTHTTKQTKNFESDSFYRIVFQRNQKKIPRATIQGPVALLIYLRPPDRKLRDIDNYIKAICDALTIGRVWTDDNQVKSLLPQWLDPDPSKKKGEAIVTIVYGDDYNKITQEFSKLSKKFTGTAICS